MLFYCDAFVATFGDVYVALARPFAVVVLALRVFVMAI